MSIVERLVDATQNLEFVIASFIASCGISPNVVTFVIFLSMAVFTIVITTLKSKDKTIMSTNDVMRYSMSEIDLRSSLILPITGAIVLVSFYYLIKYDYIESVVKFLNYYIIAMSFSSNMSSVNFVLTLLNDKFHFMKNYQISLSSTELPAGYLCDLDYKELEVKNKQNFKNYLKLNGFTLIKPSEIYPSQSIILNYGNLLAFLASSFITVNYFLTGSFIFSNLIAINFMINTLTLVRFHSIKVATLLLTLFFVYDIYFVFGSDVMVTVAKTVDLPMKLLVPILDGETIRFSLLGLGDIIIPGEFCLICHEVGSDYFIVSIISYITGLLISFIALNYYNVGQPALLYLVPSLIGSTTIYSLIKGDFNTFWNHNSSLELYDDDKNYVIDNEDIDEEDDDDYALDSYDEWEFKVEELRDQGTDIDDDDDDEDIEFYNYLEEDDDQTFIIDNGEQDLEEEDEAEDEDDEVEDISKLIEESSKDIKHWFDQQL